MNYIIIESKDVELILELYSEIFNQEKKLPKEFIYTIFEELKTYLAYDPHNEGVLVEKNPLPVYIGFANIPENLLPKNMKELRVVITWRIDENKKEVEIINFEIDYL